MEQTNPIKRVENLIRSYLKCARANYEQGRISEDFFKGGERALKLLLMELGKGEQQTMRLSNT